MPASSRELVEEFSSRTKRINAYAAAHGITDPAEKAKLAALTRENKAKTLLISELEEHLVEQVCPRNTKAALNAVKAALAAVKGGRVGPGDGGRAAGGGEGTGAKFGGVGEKGTA